MKGTHDSNDCSIIGDDSSCEHDNTDELRMSSGPIRPRSSKLVTSFALFVTIIFGLMMFVPVVDASVPGPTGYLALQMSPQLKGCDFNVVELNRTDIVSKLACLDTIELPIGNTNVSFVPQLVNFLSPNLNVTGSNGQTDYTTLAVFKAIHTVHGRQCHECNSGRRRVGTKLVTVHGVHPNRTVLCSAVRCSRRIELLRRRTEPSIQFEQCQRPAIAFIAAR